MSLPDDEEDRRAQLLRQTGEQIPEFPSGMRPREAPSLNPPLMPSTERVLARVGNVLSELSPTATEAEVREAFHNVFRELLPHRNVQLVDSAPESNTTNDGGVYLPMAVTTGQSVWVLLSGTAGDLGLDSAVVSAVRPFLVHALRSARMLARLQLRLVQTDRLATIGQSAAELLHEVNAPLSAISAQVTLLQRSTLATSDAARIARIGEASTRIQDLARKLLSFARSSQEAVGPTNLAEVLDQALLYAEPEIARVGASVERRYQAHSAVVVGNRSELTQVFVNLVTNACHSLGTAGGVVMISIEQDRGRIVVAVEDNGHGIPSEVLPQIFEPFFSTRTEEGGTGLGLSIVRALVASHDGEVRVARTDANGTRIEVEFPG